MGSMHRARFQWQVLWSINGEVGRVSIASAPASSCLLPHLYKYLVTTLFKKEDRRSVFPVYKSNVWIGMGVSVFGSFIYSGKYQIVYSSFKQENEFSMSV